MNGWMDDMQCVYWTEIEKFVLRHNIKQKYTYAYYSAGGYPAFYLMIQLWRKYIKMVFLYHLYIYYMNEYTYSFCN